MEQQQQQGGGCFVTVMMVVVVFLVLLCGIVVVWKRQHHMWCRSSTALSYDSANRLFGSGNITTDAGSRDLGDGTLIVLRVENSDPPVLVGDGFLSKEECLQLIKEYEHLLNRSTVYGKDGQHDIDDSRTSHTSFLPAGEPGTLLERVEKRAATLLSVPLAHIETLQLLRYEPSQRYNAHHDFFTEGPDAANNRIKTALIYLNDLESDDEGGGTEFPEINIEIRPKTGRVVVWQNCDAEKGKAATAENCDKRTLHAGLPTHKSIKFALNAWVRNIPVR